MAETASILLAEDDENDIFLLRRAFRSAGLPQPLMVVRDGQETIRYLNAEGIYANRKAYPWPDLLLLDLKMPRMNGFDVLNWLQKRRWPKKPLVAVLTSSTLDTDLARALELGADGYWVKPQDFAQLVGSIRELQERLLESPKTPSLGATRRQEERW